MDTPIHEESYRDHIIKIIHDADPESPRDYDNLGTMTCWHQRHSRLKEPARQGRRLSAPRGPNLRPLSYRQLLRLRRRKG